jgi:hypothetical protein
MSSYTLYTMEDDYIANKVYIVNAFLHCSMAVTKVKHDDMKKK